jgi:hypothetical protein
MTPGIAHDVNNILQIVASVLRGSTGGSHTGRQRT